MRSYTSHAIRVVAMRPVAQCLPIHPAEPCRLLAGMALPDQRYSQQMPHHRTVVRRCRQLPQRGR